MGWNRKVTLCLVVAAVIPATIPAVVAAECGPSDEGNCCYSDADCVAYPYPLLCQVVALTSTKAAELKSVGGLSPLTVIKCEGSRLDNIQEEARRAKVECDEGVCRLTDLGIR